MAKKRIAKSKSNNSKSRNLFLTIWLAFMLVANIFSVLSNILFPLASPSRFAFPLIIYLVFGFLSLANVVFIVRLLQWKKCAFWGILTSSVIAFLLNLYIGISFWVALLGFIGIIILYLAMRSSWNKFN